MLRLRQAERSLQDLEDEEGRISAKTPRDRTMKEKQFLLLYAENHARAEELLRVANENISNFRAANAPGSAEEAVDKKYMADANYLIRSPSEIAFNNYNSLKSSHS